VATPEHVASLDAALAATDLDLELARREERYLVRDAGATLASLSVDGSPDRSRFAEVIGTLIRGAADRHGAVRAFGEMVALLWARGATEDALRLERMWNELGQVAPFRLLCAYPIAFFRSGSDGVSLLRVCGEHSEIIPAEAPPMVAEASAERPGESPRVAGSAPRSDAHEATVPELQHLERAYLAAIVESSDDAIIGKTLDGIVTSWNRGAERLFGYTAGEMVGQPISRIVPTDCDDDLRTILGTVRRGESVQHHETQRVRKDGQRIHVSLTVSPIRDETGAIVGASKIARDITQRKRHEDELREQRAIIDTLYRVGLTLSAELDLERLLQAVTDAARGFTRAQFGAFYYDALDPSGDRYRLFALSGPERDAFERFGLSRNRALLEETFSGKGIVRLDDVTEDPRYHEQAPHVGTADGQLAVRSYLAVPIVGRRGAVFGGLVLGHAARGVFTGTAERLAAGLAAHAAVAIDNARLYEAERRLRNDAETSSRAKDEFLAMLGHELRNPLSSVRNAVVTATLDPSRRDRALGIARRGADQLTRLVDDLLDVARITQGKIALKKQRTRLASAIERAVEATRQIVEDRAHTLAVSLPCASVEVDGDQTRLEQVLVNLITNAAKYTERGGRIEVALELAGEEAVVRVRDDGVGIAPEVLPRVFDLFAQGERGLDRSQGGLGIGLTVVRRVIELHGGRVEAHSDGPGKGSEFVIRLPALPAVDVGVGGALERLVPQRRARILLVEDNPDVAESMQLLLEILGHEVAVVHDGPTAIDVARAHRPDVMLIDIGLPGIDGYEVARRLRAEPGLAPLTLVALTGYGRDEDKRTARAAGFDHHLTKPVEPDEIGALVASLWAAHEPRDPRSLH